MELIERLGCLTVEVDVVLEIEFLRVFQICNDDGIASCLAHQTEHFGVAGLSEDDNLRP